jgi:transcriptional regulator of acetoin/glycerol metabolism
VGHGTYHREADLEDDVEIAARTRVPVLITAPPEKALSIAQAIATRTNPAGAAAMRVCDTSAGDDVMAALAENRLKASMSRGTTTFLLREVHMLSEIEQEAIMRLLDTRPSRALDETPRIITTSSVSLFDRVQQGAFDERLFHRLNAIHIMVPSNGR